jgi:hypothetical protein
MKAIVPHKWGTADALSGAEVNTNLRAIARDIGRSQARRYTYCTVVIPIDGVADTDTAAERTVPLPHAVFSGAYPVDVVGAELSIYATAGATWTATVTDENSRTLALSVDTAGATTEAYTSSNIPLQLSSADELTFVLSASAANTITRGTLTLHLRCDRHQQGGTTLTTYTPGLVSASTSTAGSTLDTELTNAQAAVTSDESNIQHMRCVCVMANDLAAAQTWRFPSGASAYVVNSHLYVCGVAARSVDMVTVVGPTTNTNTVAATGTANLVDNASAIFTAESDDPTDTTDDITVTLTPTGGAVSRVFGFLWYG